MFMRTYPGARVKKRAFIEKVSSRMFLLISRMFLLININRLL